MQNETEAQSEIKKIFESRAKNDPNSITLANTLLSNIETAFKGDHKYVYELLQNADDEGLENTPLIVKITVIKFQQKQYLIFSHSGRHFTLNDLNNICDNAQQQNKEKTNQANKIGYKGVGFKAVFTIADQVYVISNLYKFIFDKYYKLWAACHNTKPFPWPIIPIAYNENPLPDEVLKQIDQKMVNFVLCVKNEINLTDELKFITQHPEMILFLRRLSIIEIKNGDKIDKFERVHDAQNQLMVLKKNGHIHSQWLIKQYFFTIPADQKIFLKGLSGRECPVRLQEAEQTSITFATKVVKENNKLIITPVNDAIVYSYLPTQVKTGLPFLVNGDFLLNVERSQLINNIWNNKLFYTLASYHIQWLADLTHIEIYRLQILKLLTSANGLIISDSFKMSYAQGLTQGLGDFAFVPKLGDKEHLLKISQAVLDKTNFFEELDIKWGEENKSIIDSALEDTERLLACHRVKVITKTELLNHLQHYAGLNKTLLFQKKLIKFLRKVYPDVSPLSNIVFLLSQQNELVAPDSLFFSVKHSVTIPEALNIKVLHTDLSHIDADTNSWLSSLGVSEGNPRDILVKYIFKIFQLKNNHWSYNDPLIKPITLFIFELYRKELFKPTDWVTLIQQMPILVKGQQVLTPLNCYLSDKYQPADKIELIGIKDFVFVDECYLSWPIHELAEQDKLNLWHEFFKALSIRNSIDIRQYNISSVNTIPQFAQYLNKFRNEKQIVKGPSSQHQIENYLAVDFQDYLWKKWPQKAAYCELFWRIVLLKWEIYKQITTSYIDGRNHRSALSQHYLQYIFKELPSHIAPECVLASDGKIYSPSAVFSNGLQELSTYLPVAKLPSVLTPAQAEFFGFKTLLVFEDCWTILISLCAITLKGAKLHSLNPYILILKRLSELILTVQQQLQLQQWQGCLIAENATLQPKNTLKYCDIPNQSIPPTSIEWLKNVAGLSSAAMLVLCKNFNIKVENTQTGVPIPGNYTVQEQAKIQFMNYLPALARVINHQTQEAELNILKRLVSKIQNIEFCKCDKYITIRFEDKHSLSVVAYHHNYHLFYHYNWNSPRTLFTVCEELNRILQLEITINIFHSLLQDEDPIEWLNIKGYPTNDLIALESVLLEIQNATAQPTNDVNLIAAGVGAMNINKDTKTDDAENKATTTTTGEPPTTPPRQIINTIFTTPTRDGTNVLNDETAQTGGTPPANAEVVPPSPTLRKFNINDVPLNIPKLSPFKRDLNPDGVGGAARTGTGGTRGTPSRNTAGSNNEAYDTITGEIGERIVFDRLRIYYQSRYSAVAKDTDQGFEITGTNPNKSKITLKLSWHIKMNEKFKNRDITINKTKTKIENGQEKTDNYEKYIEIKSTTSSPETPFHMSGNEYFLMRQASKRYSLFRVSHVDHQQVKLPQIDKIKDPASILVKDDPEIDVGKIEMRIKPSKQY